MVVPRRGDDDLVGRVTRKRWQLAALHQDRTYQLGEMESRHRRREIEPLVDLLERAPAKRAQPKTPPGDWGLALLAEDLIVGSSAAEEFA